MGTVLNINMRQFRKRFKVTADNVDVFEKVTGAKGVFFTFNPERYVEELNRFNIFYTMARTGE